MRRNEIFVSVAFAVRDAETHLEPWLRRLTALLRENFRYYEVLIVDDASADGTVALVERLEREEKNLRLYCLPRSRGTDLALVAALDHAIGDFTVVIDPRSDPPEPILEMVDLAAAGAEIVYALPRERVRKRGVYNRLTRAFLRIVARLNDIDLPRAMSTYRLFSRTVLNYMLEAADRHRTLFLAPALSGYKYAALEYEPLRAAAPPRRGALGELVSKAVTLTFSTSVRPLRFVSLMSLGVSGLTLLYSVYVLLAAFLMDDVAEGWASLSLQVAGLFCLVAIVLAVMSEYLLQVIELTNRRPIYHVARQSQSSTFELDRELNVDEGAGAQPRKEATG